MKSEDFHKVIQPSFRLGYTLETSKSRQRLTFDEAIQFGKIFEEKQGNKYLDQYITDILKALKKIDPNVSIDEKHKDPRVNYIEVPVIGFPYFHLTYKNQKLLYRESLTTCIGKSKSKIWCSISLISDNGESLNPYKYNEIDNITDDLVKLSHNMLGRFKNFYFDTLETIFKKKIKAENGLEIRILGLSTNVDIDHELLKLLQKGKKESLKQSINSPSNASGYTLKKYLEWIKKRFNTSDYDFGLQLLTCLPSDDNDLYGEKLSLVTYKKVRSQQEKYYCFGFEPEPFKTPLRYINSEKASRSLAIEIGRVH